MKKALVVVLGSILYIGIATAQQTLYVNAANVSGNENGTFQYPYNTVSEGIGAALAGDTIYIMPGIYTEASGDLYLKDGLVIKGQDSASVIINHGFSNSDLSMNHYTEISDVRFNSLYLGNGNGTATVVVSNCRLQEVSLYSANGYTFKVQNSTLDYGITNASGECTYWFTNNIIINGIIDDRSGAIPGVESHFIENNKISNSGLSNMTDAVVTVSSVSVTILNNLIHCTGQGSGILTSSDSPTNIIGNTILLNNGSPIQGTFGIKTSAGYGVVRENTIQGAGVGYHSHSFAELFESNTIRQCNIGFYSRGAEEVKNNLIENCTSDGMVLYGIRGPISGNEIRSNGGAGIRLLQNVDLGGGPDSCPGNNTIQGNADFDLYVAIPPQTHPFTVFADHNIWDHSDSADIAAYDIYIPNELQGTVSVHIWPVGPSGLSEAFPLDLVRIFPNPTEGMLCVSGLPRSAWQMCLRDLSGRKVISWQGVPGGDLFEISIAELQPGVYLAVLSMDGKRSTRKIIKY